MAARQTAREGENHPIFHPKSIPGLMAQAFPAECKVCRNIGIVFKALLLDKQIRIKKKKKLKKKSFPRHKTHQGKLLELFYFPFVVTEAQDIFKQLVEKKWEASPISMYSQHAKA